MEESYEINYIAVKGGSIKIRYSVSPTGGVPEENIVSRSDKPHEDFQRVWSKLANIARRFLEMPLENSDGGQLQVWVSKVNFPVHKDYGEGMQIVVQLSGFTNCTQALQVVTHKFYRRAAEYIDLPTGGKIPCQELLLDEIKTMKELQKEAFAYAYHCKREQPTVEEAQHAYESGAYPDEIGRNKA